MTKHPASHVDHALTAAQLAYLLERFADRRAFFLETIELPEALGTVPCGLYGPIMGDAPVPEEDAAYSKRGDRAWPTRVVDRPARGTRQLTVIAGPHEEPCPLCGGTGTVERVGVQASYGMHAGPVVRHVRCTCEDGVIKHACILYTAFGGPAAPQEPGDPGCKDPAASAAFWRGHALSTAL